MIGAPLLQCDCFHNKAPFYWDKYLGRGIIAGSSLPPELRNLSTMRMALGERVKLVIKTLRNARPYFVRFHLPYGATWLCRHPIALHPVKEYHEWLDMWYVLDAWDAYFGHQPHWERVQRHESLSAFNGLK
mmetsp:Transcript_63836/g.126202  ORF Transcript_63836/g.126202 Transcript_63836/m.126202 type:complete len:131 (-) Transcript_63836:32-424(-)